MSLVSDVELARNRETGAVLLNQASDLQAQKTALQTEVQNLKAQFQIDIPADVWNRANFVAAGKALTNLQLTNQKLSSVKTQLETIKPLLQDANYEAEVQAVIDSL